MQLMDADLDATKQVSQIETAISENAEAILLNRAAWTVDDRVETRLMTTGIPVLVIR